MKIIVYCLIVLLIVSCSASIYLQNRAKNSHQVITTEQSVAVDSTNVDVNVKHSK